jgi:uncharacterized membrane protein
MSLVSLVAKFSLEFLVSLVRFSFFILKSLLGLLEVVSILVSQYGTNATLNISMNSGNLFSQCFSFGCIDGSSCLSHLPVDT